MSEEKVGVNEIMMFGIGIWSIIAQQVLKITKLNMFKTRLENKRFKHMEECFHSWVERWS